MTKGDLIDLIKSLDKDCELDLEDLAFYSVPEIIGEVYREYHGNDLNEPLLICLMTLLIKG